MFADRTLAHLVESAEARLTLAMGRLVQAHDTAALVVPIGEGVVVSTHDGSPFDKGIGIGLEPLDEAAFVELEGEIRALGRPLRFEICTLADPSVFRLLCARGYLLAGFENVLGRPLDDVGAPLEQRGIAIDEVDESDPTSAAAWIDTVTRGFLHPDVYDGPAPPDEDLGGEALRGVFADMARAPGVKRMIARHEGALAGAGLLRVDGDIAQLSGASTLPEHRRRGVQRALLHERLARAARAGCRLAVVTTAPGSTSQANVGKAGFSLLYSRAIFTHDP